MHAGVEVADVDTAKSLMRAMMSGSLDGEAAANGDEEMRDDVTVPGTNPRPQPQPRSQSLVVCIYLISLQETSSDKA